MTDQLAEKVSVAIERLKAFEPKNGEGYHLAFSGGKDSCVIKALADMAGVKYTAVYRVTGIDPPELVRFIKKHQPDVVFEIPRYADGKRITMFNLIVKKKFPPIRRHRYCCEYLKESSGDGKLTITGVRWAESANRKNNNGIANIYSESKKDDSGVSESNDYKKNKNGGFILVNDNDESRRMIEQCYKRHKTTLNPIIDWTDGDVWDFLKEYQIPYCELYDRGIKRIGCIGCPLSGRNQEKELLRYPKYRKLYIMAFEKMLEERKKAGRETICWDTGEDVYNWWVQNGALSGQIKMEDWDESQ